MTKWVIEEPDEFFVESDYYLIEGEKYYRITRIKGVINQYGLNQWFKNNDAKTINKIMKASQIRGTKTHKLFELKLQNKKITKSKYSEEIRENLDLFTPFEEDCELKADAVEQHLWNKEYAIAGTADYIGYYKSCKKYLKRGHEPKFNEKSYVIGDWKTSSGIYDDFWLQLATYVYMFEKQTGVKIDGAFIAQFKNGKLKIEEKTREELAHYFEVFKHVLKVFLYTKGEF
jgi:hypothetical protein